MVSGLRATDREGKSEQTNTLLVFVFSWSLADSKKHLEYFQPYPLNLGHIKCSRKERLALYIYIRNFHGQAFLSFALRLPLDYTITFICPAWHPIVSSCAISTFVPQIPPLLCSCSKGCTPHQYTRSDRGYGKVRAQRWVPGSLSRSPSIGSGSA